MPSMEATSTGVADTSVVNVTTTCSWPAKFLKDGSLGRGKKKPAEQCAKVAKEPDRIPHRSTVKPFSKRQFKSLCRPRSIWSVVSQFTDLQREAVKELGFDGLLKVSIQVSPQDLYGWLLDAFNPGNGVLSARGSPIFQVTEADMRDVLLLPNEGITVRESNNSSRCRDLRAAWAKKYSIVSGMFSIRKIKIVMMSLVKGCDDFKRLFVLYVVSCFLSPTSNRNVRPGILHMLVDVDLIPKMNWCAYVLQSLCSSITTWRKNDLTHVGGCLMILQVCYLYRHSWWSETLPRELPLIQHWNDQKLKERIDGELASGGFGLDFFTLEGFPVSAQQSKVAGGGGRTVTLEVDSDLLTDLEIERVYTTEFDRSLAKTKRDFDLFYRRNLSTLITAPQPRGDSCTEVARNFVSDIDKMVDGLTKIKEVVLERKDMDLVLYEHPVVSTKLPECRAIIDEYGSNLSSGEKITPPDESLQQSQDVDQGYFVQNLTQLLAAADNPDLSWVQPAAADNPDPSWVQPLVIAAETMESLKSDDSESDGSDSEYCDYSDDATNVVDADITNLEVANELLLNSAPSSPVLDDALQTNLSNIVQSFGSELRQGKCDTLVSMPSPGQVQIKEMLAELNSMEHVQLRSKLFRSYTSMMKLKRHDAIISDFCISVQKEYSRSTSLFSDGGVCLADALDFGSLEAGEEISTVILNAFAMTINHKKPMPAKPCMVCLDVIPNYSPLVCASVAFTMWNETLESSRQSILSSEMVMVLVLMNEHYFCVVANTKRAKFQYLDSLTHKNNIEEWMGSLPLLQKLLADYMISKGHHRGGEVAHYEIEIVQGSWRAESGDKDCGVYVMHHMRYFRGDEVVESDVLSSPAKRNEFRAIICAKLITSRANRCRNKVVVAVLEHFKNNL